MTRVTSKLQVSIPRAVADRAGIRVGDELEWETSGGAVIVRRAAGAPADLSVAERLRQFDLATARQARRNAAYKGRGSNARGWTREELYRR